MESKLPYTHLIYVRKYSILDNDYKLYAYGVNTKDIHHTIGEIVCRTLEDIKRIDYVECSQSSLDYLKEQDIKIYDFYNKYELEQTPTEEEIKKEWEKLGFKWEEEIYCIKLTNLKEDKVIVFGFASKSYYCKCIKGYAYRNFTFQEHQLLTKTFKMLGWEV